MLTFLVGCGSKEVEPGTDSNSKEAKEHETFILDSFDNVSTTESEKFPNYVLTQEGYDIYYENAKAQLSRIPINPQNPTDKALRITYQLSREFSWGNWLSIRHQLKSPVDLTGYKGLELNLKVEIPSPNVILRITLVDLMDNNEKIDELWWFDCEPGLLTGKIKNWIKIRIPFDDARLSYGGGSRHNDSKLNLKKIFAYEINLILEAGEKVGSSILLNSLCAYKK